MNLNVNLWDLTLPGQRTGAGSIALKEKCVTARALIEARVRREVEAFNAAREEEGSKLMPLTPEERMLNGERVRTVDADLECERAVKAFLSNAFLLFVDGTQVIEADVPLALHAGSELEFIRVLPLIGG